MAAMVNPNTRGAGRRAFLKTLPAAAAAAVVGPAVSATSVAPVDSAISKDTLACSEPLTGVVFSEAEYEGIAENVATNRRHYDPLRDVAVDYDVEPPFMFN